jgi:hypothetical protein
MTEEDVLKMTVEEIIYLPNFLSLHRGQSGSNEYWQVYFMAKPRKDGLFEIFGKTIPTPTYFIYITQTISNASRPHQAIP